jgi:hypothetical protein
VEVIQQEKAPPQWWTAERLAMLTPGASVHQWYRRLIPILVDRGVLERVGKYLVGRKEEIIAELVQLPRWDVKEKGEDE